MTKQRRSIWLLAALFLACTGAALVTLTAAEQKSSATVPPAAAAPPAAGTQPATGAKPAPATAQPSPDSDDDSTVPSDSRESADNNVSFPVDI